MEVQSCDMRLRLCFLAIHRIHPEVELTSYRSANYQAISKESYWLVQSLEGNNPVAVWSEK